MRPWNEKGELKEKGKRVGKQNLLIKGGNYRRKARRQKNSCIKTPKTIHINKTTQNPCWGSRTDPMITGTQHRYWYQYQYQYHHHSPKNHEPLPLTFTQNSRTQSQNQEPMNQWTKTQGSRTMSLCHTISLYSKFKNQESKTKTKEPRLKSQEQWAMGRNQHQRARPIEPRFKIPNQDSKILRSKGKGRMTWTIWQ